MILIKMIIYYNYKLNFFVSFILYNEKKIEKSLMKSDEKNTFKEKI
jgi:hypothetical protein